MHTQNTQYAHTIVLNNLTRNFMTIGVESRETKLNSVKDISSLCCLERKSKLRYIICECGYLPLSACAGYRQYHT